MSKGGRGESDGAKALRMVTSTNKAIKGYKMTPTDLPKAFVEAPWNSWTFERTNTSSSAFEEISLTVDDICTQIATKLEIGFIDRVRIKIQAAQVWCMAGTSLITPDVEVRFFDLVQDAKQHRSLQRVIGNWNKPAKAGFVYPIVDKQEVLGIDEATRTVLSAKPATIDSKVTQRVQVLWKSYLP